MNIEMKRDQETQNYVRQKENNKTDTNNNKET